MADNHPTIDILSDPSYDCPVAVWNCAEFCFEATDQLLASGSAAFMTILFTATDQADGLEITIGDFVFTSATPGGLNTWQWSGTQNQISDDFVRMLRANFEFSQQFDVSIIAPGVGQTIMITAREFGEASNWGYTLPDPAVADPPTIIFSQGTDIEVRPNYRLVVEIWTCTDGLPDDIVSTLGYEPDPYTGELCIDVSRALRELVATTFPGLGTNIAIATDETIVADFCLRYGEMYADDILACDTIPRYFEFTGIRQAINSAFQKDDEDKIGPFCYGDTYPPRFLTNRPDYGDICRDSFAWLWYYYDETPANLINSDVNMQVEYLIVFTYTDGTSTTIDVQATADFEGRRALLIPAGLAQLGSMAMAPKIVASYSIQLRAWNYVGGFGFLLSEPFNFTVANDSFCCCKEEFYFLSEPGGYDTILFNCVNEVSLSTTYTEFCSYETCGGDILQGGKQEAERKAFETYRVSSRFVDNYDNVEWLREFFKSPIRLWRHEDKVYKIVLLTSEIPMYRKEGFIFIEFEYILSFELNQQQL